MNFSFITLKNVYYLLLGSFNFVSKKLGSLKLSSVLDICFTSHNSGYDYHTTIPCAMGSKVTNSIPHGGGGVHSRYNMGSFPWRGVAGRIYPQMQEMWSHLKGGERNSEERAGLWINEINSWKIIIDSFYCFCLVANSVLRSTLAAFPSNVKLSQPYGDFDVWF